jgi:hypothetical protein
VFENLEFKRIFGPKREKEKRGWRKFHTEELHDLLSLPGSRADPGLVGPDVI